MKNRGNLTPRHPKTPQPMVTKICVGDYVGDVYHRAKCYPNRFRGFGSAHAWLRATRHKVTRLLFWGFLASCCTRWQIVTFVRITQTELNPTIRTPFSHLTDSSFKRCLTWSYRYLWPHFVIVSGILDHFSWRRQMNKWKFSNSNPSSCGPRVSRCQPWTGQKSGLTSISNGTELS